MVSVAKCVAVFAAGQQRFYRAMIVLKNVARVKEQMVVKGVRGVLRG